MVDHIIRPDVVEFCKDATYAQMLAQQRFTPAGDPFFQMDPPTWEYWTQQFNEKREATGDNGVSASKQLGW